MADTNIPAVTIRRFDDLCGFNDALFTYMERWGLGNVTP